MIVSLGRPCLHADIWQLAAPTVSDPQRGEQGYLEMAAPKLTVKELEGLLSAEFPGMFNPQDGYTIEELWHGGCRVRKHFDRESLRPGGTISGTAMMALTDIAMYVAILGTIGWKPLTVTTNLTINFLRKPAARDLLAEARLMKLGKRLAVGDIGIRSDGQDDLVAHATSTYSIPER
jgi:uncharacterized protein (TIGR00369 family)